MPGNLGGMGRIFGSLRGGMGGMRGMGNMAGGMGGGMGPMGGMNGMGAALSQDTSRADAAAAEEYDVDRWKRADEQEQWNRQNGTGEKSALEQVRQEWEKKNEKKTSRLRRLLRKDGKKKEELPVGYTEHGTLNVRSSPGRRSEEERRLQNLSETAADASEKTDREKSFSAGAGDENGAGRDGMIPHTREFRRFFTENPVNSVLLAYDSLSTGPLTLNQVVQSAEGRAAAGWSHDSTTGYMDNLRASGQRRKYEVHIVE